MDKVDRKILALIQKDSRLSCGQIANSVGVSVSTANERIRKLDASKRIRAWRAVIDPDLAGLHLCAFVLLDMAYENEAENCASLVALPEVQELHHISGARSYLMKIRVSGTAALQALLRDKIKPLAGAMATESMLVLQTEKETSEMMLP
ncbi:hypothetical protein MNBD_ALPHA06-1913 [hydrothermal vent metagenome]|uniref:HTH asnC-type domain-containing protein n=1 Tax=hydrothermal vent metagenome TaxID=652676 RepID=A0A3B0RAV8_9ZZZZ